MRFYFGNCAFFILEEIMENRAALIDGEYKAEITLGGGTGRTTIQSPANVYIENGVITAEIIWSSTKYDLMIIGDKEYKSISNDGHSLFLVELPSLDVPIEIRAETVAMSTPHLIDYTITVSGAEILRTEDPSENTSEVSSEYSSESLSEEELQSRIESMMNESVSGETITVLSFVVEEPKTSGGGLPAIGVFAISAALGAAVAFVAVTVGKKKK